MKKPVKIKAPAVTRIVDSSPKPKRISGEEVAEALGANPAGRTIRGNLPPSAHVQLVAQVAAEIVSTGGRPARKEQIERKKIPLTKNEWDKLKEIAEECNLQGVTASPAQICGLIVSEGLRKYEVPQDVLGAAASSSTSLQHLNPVANALLHAMKERKPSRKRKSGD